MISKTGLGRLTWLPNTMPNPFLPRKNANGVNAADVVDALSWPITGTYSLAHSNAHSQYAISYKWLT